MKVFTDCEYSYKELKQKLNGINGVKVCKESEAVFCNDESLQFVENLLDDSGYDLSEYVSYFDCGQWVNVFDNRIELTKAECVNMLLENGTKELEIMILNCNDDEIDALIENLIKSKVQFIIDRYIFKLQAERTQLEKCNFKWK